MRARFTGLPVRLYFTLCVINIDTGVKMSTHAAVLGMSDRVRAIVGKQRAGNFNSRDYRGQNSDAFQDAMVKMLTVAANYTGENGASIETYLHTVAKHEVMKSVIQSGRPCWAPRSPQHVEVLPKHSVVEFSTQSKPCDPAREYDAAVIKDRVGAIIDASAYPAAVREVLLDEVAVRAAAGAHGLTQAELQSCVSQVKKAIKADAKLRELA